MGKIDQPVLHLKVHGIEDICQTTYLNMRMYYPFNRKHVIKESLMGTPRLSRPSSEHDAIHMTAVVCLETPLKTYTNLSAFKSST